MINGVLRHAVYYIEAMLKRPLWMIGPAALTMAIGTLVILTLPRSYQSEAQLLIESPRTLASLVPATAANESLQFVEQRVLARDKLIALADKFQLFPALRNTMSHTKLAQLIRQQIVIQSFASEPGERQLGATAMRVAFTASSPELASSITAELVNRIIEESRGQRIQRAKEISEFLSREVAEMAEKLKTRETEWESFLNKNADALPTRMEGIESELQEKDRALTGMEQSVVSLDEELRLLEAELRLGMQRPQAATRDRTRLAELEADLAVKSLTYSDAHPTIHALKQQIDGMRQQIASEAAQGEQSAQHALPPDLALVAERIDLAKARQASLMAKRSEIEKQITWLRTTRARGPAVQAQAEAIGRERETLQGSLDEMRGRLSTARISERLDRDSATANVQILEQPETPLYPSSPSRKRAMLLLAAAALAAAAGGVYLGDTLRNTIRGRFDLKEQLAGSTLVVIPRWVPHAAPRTMSQAALDWVSGLIGHGHPVAR